VQNCLKFSAVFGTISLNNSNFIRPKAVSPIEISIKTIGRGSFAVAAAILLSVLAVEVKELYSAKVL